MLRSDLQPGGRIDPVTGMRPGGGKPATRRLAVRACGPAEASQLCRAEPATPGCVPGAPISPTPAATARSICLPGTHRAGEPACPGAAEDRRRPAVCPWYHDSVLDTRWQTVVPLRTPSLRRRSVSRQSMSTGYNNHCVDRVMPQGANEPERRTVHGPGRRRESRVPNPYTRSPGDHPDNPPVCSQ